jgi:hypothetical protein
MADERKFTSHPEREWFRGVAEHHLQRALRFQA